MGILRVAFAPSGSRAAVTGLSTVDIRASPRVAEVMSGREKSVVVGRTSPTSSLSGPSRMRSFSSRNARTRSL